MFSEVRKHVFAPMVLEQALRRSGNEPVVLDVAAAQLPEPEAIEAAAWAEGFERGHSSGMRSARAEQDVAILELVSLVRNAVEDADEFTRALERQVVELSLAVAERVIEREIRSDPALVVEVVRDALEGVRGATTATVRVNPGDHEMLAGSWERLALPFVDRAHLVVDERIERGGCLIETHSGVVDAQPSSKLSVIAEGFAALLEGEPL